MKPPKHQLDVLKKKLSFMRLLRRQLNQQLKWSEIGNMDRVELLFQNIQKKLLQIQKINIPENIGDENPEMHSLILKTQKIKEECNVLNNQVQAELLSEKKMIGTEIIQMQLEQELKRLRN